MKELEPKNQDKQELVVPATTSKVIQSLKPYPGHRVFELNIEQGLIREAEVERNVVLGESGPRKSGKVMMKPGCIYCTALNAHSADKKFLKMLAIHAIINRKK